MDVAIYGIQVGLGLRGDGERQLQHVVAEECEERK
jgi:hypothetical protein